MGSQENFKNFMTGLDQKVSNADDAADAMDEQIAKINADIDGLEYACEQAGTSVQNTAMAISFATADYYHTFDKYFSGHIDLDSTSSSDSETNLWDWQVHHTLSIKADGPDQIGKFHPGVPSGYDTTGSTGSCVTYNPAIPEGPGGDPPAVPESWTVSGQAQFYIDSTDNTLYNLLNDIKNNPLSKDNQKNWLAIQQGDDATNISIVTITCIDYWNSNSKYYTVLCINSLPTSGSNTYGNTATFDVNTATKISQIVYSYYRNTRPVQGTFDGVTPFTAGDAGQNWGMDSTSDATIEKQVGENGIYRYCLKYCWAPIDLNGTYGLVAQRDNLETGKSVNANNQNNDKTGQTTLGDIT